MNQDFYQQTEASPRIFYGYIIAVAGFFAMGAMYSSRYAFGVFFKPLLTEFGWTRAMTAGALGMSTGLVYPTGCFAETGEIVALSRVIAHYGGIYASHIRGERETITEAVKEAIVSALCDVAYYRS